MICTDALSGDKLRFWWFNPREGTHIDLGVFDKRSRVEVSPPYLGEDLDFILVIDDAGYRFPPPGRGPSRPTGERRRNPFALIIPAGTRTKVNLIQQRSRIGRRTPPSNQLRIGTR